MSDPVLLSAPNLIHYNIRELLTNGAWRNGCFRRLKNVRGRGARLELTLRSGHVNYPFLMKM